MCGSTWCTLCSLALRHLSQCLPIFREKYGADMVAISGQLPEHNRACEAAHQLGFPVLCDKGERGEPDGWQAAVLHLFVSAARVVSRLCLNVCSQYHVYYWAYVLVEFISRLKYPFACEHAQGWRSRTSWASATA